ncbi:YTH domain-containing protein 1-like, partial [Arabidopsis lyrata subsp. lyrata]
MTDEVEIDPEDMLYNESDESSDEESDKRRDEEGDKGRDEEGDKGSDESSNEESDNVIADEEEHEDNGEKKTRKGKKKEEESEDVLERDEYEVQESVAKFVDEIRIARNTIPESSDEDEDPIVVRDRRIKRGRGSDRFAIGDAFLTGVEFKEAILDYALKTGQNVVQERWEKDKISFKCGMNGKCLWRVYCSYDEPRQLYLVKTVYA